MRLRRVGVRPGTGLDGEELALVVPLIERVRPVEPRMALQPDQPGAV